ncbi:acyl-CoA dehydrogenase family protein [Saccharopolyspora hattusasensis]|uniref:acyl-CoA dehydrogenase family protein n=1 Tax=Saccharopolyspora hattusasensis TaxID=1128679 RepID=UPI003D959179
MDSADKDAPPRGAVSDMLEFLRWYSRERVDSRRMDERRSYSTSLVSDFASVGLFGLQIPKAYQGLELSHTDMFRVIRQLGAIDANLVVLTIVHNTLGVPPVRYFAREEVKAAVLPELAQGKRLITSAISEPGLGSHVRAITTRAVKQSDGSYVINGNKQWISLGADAAYVNVFARLADEHGRDLGITGFLIDTKTPGFVGGPEVITLGLKALPQNSLEFRNLRVPAQSLLGVEGGGLLAAKDAFMRGRVTLPAATLGAAMRSLELAHRFARRREVATGNLAENGRIQQIFSECVAATEAVETLLQHIVGRLDAAENVPEELYFAAKILGCELMWHVVDRCVQLLGARGFVDTNVVGQLYRDYRLFRIFEGTTEAITVYLGTRFLAAPERLGVLFDEVNATPQLQELAARVTKLTTAPIMDAKHRHVLANAVGELACWTILAGLTGETRHESGMKAHAAAWCERHLSERLRSAEQDLPFADLPTVDEVAGHIAGFATAIGDLEQRRPGDQHDLDVLLRHG